MKYFNCLEVSNLKYSIDMIRFKFELSKYYQEKLYLLIKSLGVYDYYVSNRPFSYRELFKIKTFDLKYSFTLGVSLNGAKRSDSELCFIEFNPNKLYDSIELARVITFINNFKTNLELALYDIAIDIPFGKKYVSIIKDRRVYKKFVYDCDGNNVTEYLGQTADSGRVKLYNKAVESNLNYDLTRLELTTNCLDYLVVQKQMPKLLVCVNFDLFAPTKLSKSDYVLLQLLWLCDNPNYYYRQLGRDKQEKLKPFVSSNFSLNFSEKVFNHLIKTINIFKDKNYEIQKENL